VRTRYNYLGETTIEVVIDGESVEVNLLPPGPAAAPPAYSPPPDPVPVAAPLELCAAAPAPTLKRRTLMGVIRTTKTILFTIGGEALVYAANNLAGLNLPPGLGLVVGATAYGVQKAIKPDGLL